jgi:hypothetical protein
VAQWTTPKSRKDVEAFLGYMNYHREHIKDFAALATPLYDLTKPKCTFEWTEIQDKAFKSLRHTMSQSAILAFPNAQDLFILDTDASDYAIGANFHSCKMARKY